MAVPGIHPEASPVDCALPNVPSLPEAGGDHARRKPGTAACASKEYRPLPQAARNASVGPRTLVHRAPSKRRASLLEADSARGVLGPPLRAPAEDRGTNGDA